MKAVEAHEAFVGALVEYNGSDARIARLNLQGTRAIITKELPGLGPIRFAETTAVSMREVATADLRWRATSRST